MNITVKTHVNKILYSNDDFKIMGCSLAEDNPNVLLNQYNGFTVTGNAPMIYEGDTRNLLLEPIDHPKFGLQYKLIKILDFTKLDANSLTPEQEYNILSTVITTPQQAKNINDVYPNFIRLILSGESDKIDLKQIYNVGKAYFQAYKEKIIKEFETLVITSQFPDLDLKSEEAKLLLRKFNQSTKKVVSELKDHPYYCLSIYNNRNFLKTDELLSNLRPDLLHSYQRCETLAYWVLKDNEYEGNTRMSAHDMAKYALAHAPELIDIIKPCISEASHIYYDEKTNTVANYSTFTSEQFIAKTIRRLESQPVKYDIDWKEYNTVEDMKLTDNQLEFLHLVCDNSVVMLNGYSGTGKTTAVKALITMLEDYNLKYMLVAPTGIASKVLREATGRSAYTIHKALHDCLPLDIDVLIVDELSMQGVDHLQMVCSSLSEKTKLVMIGDDAQLASINCGNIIHDLQQWGGIPTVNLTQVFRYGEGDIDTIATDTRNEKMFLDSNGKLLFNSNGQYKFIEADNNVLNQVVKAYEDAINQGYKQDEIIVLSPYNVGNYGTYAINQAIQEKFNLNKTNPFIPTKHKDDIELQFLKHDRVLNTKNHYDTPCYIDFDSDDELIQAYTDIFNGDIGVVHQTNKDSMVVEIDDTLIEINNKQGNEFLLGYAISIHKIQGGAAKVVILLTTNHHKRMLTNNLLYVALTRAKEKIIHIGDVEAVNGCLVKHETEHRNTWLYDLLKGGSEHRLCN